MEPGAFQTQISEPRNTEKQVRQGWDDLSEELKKEYGRDYLEKGKWYPYVTFTSLHYRRDFLYECHFKFRDRSSDACATSFRGSLSLSLQGPRRRETLGTKVTRARNQRTRVINTSSYSAEPFPRTKPGGKPWNRDESYLLSVAHFHSTECESETQVDNVQ